MTGADSATPATSANGDAEQSPHKRKESGAGRAAPNQQECDDGYPPPCCNPGGHSWVISEEDDRCYCEYCLADGDA